MDKSFQVFSGLTRRRWTGLVLSLLSVIILFTLLYITARRVVIDEIRYHAMGVAIAVAAGIDADDIEEIHTPDDMDKPAFRRVQKLLDRVSIQSPDVRYIYTMRRSMEPGATETDYLFVVDQSPRDLDGDGIISEDEMSEDPGDPYDATTWPQLVEAWHRPAADRRIQPDPPYPDLISGYAPVKNDAGQTVAVVGVDIAADTVHAKLLAIQVAIGGASVIIIILITLVVSLYYQQREAFEQIKRLSEELASRNEMLRASNKELAAHNERIERDLKLAQTVQLGFLPTAFPRKDRLAFDKFYLTSDVLGGDLFDVFSLDHDHVAMYMADVSGHGVSAALISGLLKMAVASVKEKGGFARGHLHADLYQPDRVLYTLNEMLVKEIPEYEFITMIYAVLDLSNDTFRIANAGHPSPIRFSLHRKELNVWSMPSGPALGFIEDQDYPATELRVAEGDRIIFYTDGLTEAMNPHTEEFGEERLLALIREHGVDSPSAIIEVVRGAVDLHRNGEKVSDDFSMLVTEIR
jgi:phosphoserine phosphatase RsbU/P